MTIFDYNLSNFLILTLTVRDPAIKVVQSRALSAMLSNSTTEPTFRSLIASTMGGETSVAF